jgi:hypothetical protein
MKGTGLPIGKPVLLLICDYLLLLGKNLVLIEHQVMGPKLTQAEGFILGVGAKMFTIAGPVIVYGLSAGVLYGIILWITL